MTGPSVVFGAEALLAYLDDDPGADAVERTIADVRAERVRGYVNYITLAEVSGVAERTLDSDLVRAYVDTLLASGIEPVDAAPVWDRAARVHAEHGLPLGAAFAIATAYETDSTALVDADDDFEEAAGDLIEHVRPDDE